MSPQNGKNDGENGEPDISEIAKRWRQGAPSEPREEPEQAREAEGSDEGSDQSSEDEDRRVIDADGLVVSYHGRGSIYLPRSLQKRLGSDDWDTRTKIPADYDEETHDLTIHFGSLVGDSE